MKVMGMYAHPYVPEALEHGWNEDPIGRESRAESIPCLFQRPQDVDLWRYKRDSKNIMAKMVLGL